MLHFFKKSIHLRGESKVPLNESQRMKLYPKLKGSQQEYKVLFENLNAKKNSFLIFLLALKDWIEDSKNVKNLDSKVKYRHFIGQILEFLQQWNTSLGELVEASLILRKSELFINEKGALCVHYDKNARIFLKAKRMLHKDIRIFEEVLSKLGLINELKQMIDLYKQQKLRFREQDPSLDSEFMLDSILTYSINTFETMDLKVPGEVESPFHFNPDDLHFEIDFE